MINLNPFKKKAQGVESNKYPDVVYEIHGQFNTASDRLLKEAIKIIKECEGKDINKGERLLALGFTKAKQVVEVKEAKNKKKVNESLASIIQRYSLLYPNNKFITEDEVIAICEKYKLVFGNVSDFTGFIPEKNLIEIEKFTPKDEDIALEVRLWGSDGSLREELVLVSKKKVIESDTYKRQGWVFGADIDRPEFKYGEIQKEAKLKIAAPVKDFDLTGKEVRGFKIFKTTPPDPVVLQPVNGGYLILTAWGDEASDPIVVNHKMN
jgi:hypothetical protein